MQGHIPPQNLNMPMAPFPMGMMPPPPMMPPMQKPPHHGQQRGGPPDDRQALNSLYKTQMCKHFMNENSCSKGNSCHFAHGQSELRRRNEELP